MAHPRHIRFAPRLPDRFVCTARDAHLWLSASQSVSESRLPEAGCRFGQGGRPRLVSRHVPSTPLRCRPRGGKVGGSSWCRNHSTHSIRPGRRLFVNQTPLTGRAGVFVNRHIYLTSPLNISLVLTFGFAPTTYRLCRPPNCVRVRHISNISPIT